MKKAQAIFTSCGLPLPELGQQLIQFEGLEFLSRHFHKYFPSPLTSKCCSCRIKVNTVELFLCAHTYKHIVQASKALALIS